MNQETAAAAKLAAAETAAVAVEDRVGPQEPASSGSSHLGG